MTGRLTEQQNNGPPSGAGRNVPNNSIFAALLLCFLLLGSPGVGHPGERIELGNWSAAEVGGLPDSWELLRFPSIASATSYEIVQDSVYGQVIQARSLSGAGGIGRALAVDPYRYPILSWSWKIHRTLPGSSLNSEYGDDFPARVMVSFKIEGAKRRGLQDNILCYVWAQHEAVGTVAVNPVHRHIKTFVAASGSKQSGSWQEMSRDLVADYRTAFSGEPGTITGVVLMTDSDNTESEAQAWYGPIFLSGDEDAASEIQKK